MVKNISVSTMQFIQTALIQTIQCSKSSQINGQKHLCFQQCSLFKQL